MDTKSVEETIDPSMGASQSYLRFPLSTRVLHWLSAATIFTLLWSGFWIFNLHPRLYWGDTGHFGTPAIAELAIVGSGDERRSEIRIGELSIEVTNLMGLGNGQPYVRVFNFPDGFQFGGTRALHFTAAWLFLLSWLAYVYHLTASGRLRKNWWPRAGELSPRNIGRDILDHVRLRRAKGEEAKRYNILQKLSYLLVMFLLIPAFIVSGLTMSNSITTAFPFLFDILGGRQSARTIHFICASLLSLFVVVHLLQLVVIGFINHGRAMITGRLSIKSEDDG